MFSRYQLAAMTPDGEESGLSRPRVSVGATQTD